MSRSTRWATPTPTPTPTPTRVEERMEGWGRVGVIGDVEDSPVPVSCVCVYLLQTPHPPQLSLPSRQPLRCWSLLSPHVTPSRPCGLPSL